VTTIGLISDVHATPSPIAEALSIFKQAGVEQILCAGDIAGYGDQLEQSIALLADSGCHTILGNHDLRYLDQIADDVDNLAAAFFRQLTTSLNMTIAGRRVYMVHGRPPDDCLNGIKLLNGEGEAESDRIAFWADELKTFQCDVLVVGHTHQVFAERVGDILVVNPGSALFNHSCAILNLPEMDVQVFPLSNKEIEKTWSYSDYLAGRG
jgi:putative phosphoesterase